MQKKLGIKLKYYNFRLLFLVLLLTVLGIIVIGSAAPGKGYQSKQVIGLAAGLVGLIVMSMVNYHFFLKLHWIIYLLCNAILLVVLIAGKNVNGATRWIKITESISLQPSEFAKIMMLVFWAWLFGHDADFIKKWKNFFISAFLTVIPLLLIVKEPDLSTTILFSGIFVIILFVAEFSYKKFAILLAAFLPIVAGLVIFVQAVPPPNNPILKEYQYKRIMSFINPDDYDDLRYQQDNSVIAIGSGKLSGKGLYNDSTESVKNGNYIAEPQTDFIFAVIGEETGFAGGITVIVLLLLIVIECVITGARAPDMAGKIICIGMGTILTFQTFINIGVATELLPNTGIPLPFVSYGLSSLVAMYAGIGLVLNVGIRKKAALEEFKNEHRFDRS